MGTRYAPKGSVQLNVQFPDCEHFDADLYPERIMSREEAFARVQKLLETFPLPESIQFHSIAETHPVGTFEHLR